jgi:hypothetical protein
MREEVAENVRRHRALAARGVGHHDASDRRARGCDRPGDGEIVRVATEASRSVTLHAWIPFGARHSRRRRGLG